MYLLMNLMKLISHDYFVITRKKDTFLEITDS